MAEPTILLTGCGGIPAQNVLWGCGTATTSTESSRSEDRRSLWSGLFADSRSGGLRALGVRVPPPAYRPDLLHETRPDGSLLRPGD